jgi:hypothetical protein
MDPGGSLGSCSSLPATVLLLHLHSKPRRTSFSTLSHRSSLVAIVLVKRCLPRQTLLDGYGWTLIRTGSG